MHLLAWEVIYWPTRDERLGIQSLIVREALIAKHAVRFLLCLDSIWNSLMRAKYNPWIVPDEIRPPQSYSIMWKELYSHAREVMT